MVLHKFKLISIILFLSLLRLQSYFNTSSSKLVHLPSSDQCFQTSCLSCQKSVRCCFFFLFNYKFCNASWILLTVFKFLK